MLSLSKHKRKGLPHTSTGLSMTTLGAHLENIICLTKTESQSELQKK